MSLTSRNPFGAFVALVIAAALGGAPGSGAVAHRQDDGPAVEITPPPGLVALASGDPEGQRLRYAWDFDADGRADGDVDRPVVVAFAPNPQRP